MCNVLPSRAKSRKYSQRPIRWDASQGSPGPPELTSLIYLLSGRPFPVFAGPPGAGLFKIWPQRTLGKGRILSRQPLLSGFLRTEIFDDVVTVSSSVAPAAA